MKFGEKITNIAAGETNPNRHCYFVEVNTNGIRCTNAKGWFWHTQPRSIKRGHLKAHSVRPTDGDEL